MAYTFPYNDPGAVTAASILAQIPAAPTAEEIIAQIPSTPVPVPYAGTINPNTDITTGNNIALPVIQDAAVSGYSIVSGTNITIAESGYYIAGYTLPFEYSAAGRRWSWMAKNNTYTALPTGSFYLALQNKTISNATYTRAFTTTADVALPLPSAGVTMEFLYKPTNFGTYVNGNPTIGQMIINYYANYTYPVFNKGMAIFQCQNGDIGIFSQCDYFSASELVIWNTSHDYNTLGNWHHIAVTHVGNDIRLHIDGSYVGTKTLTKAPYADANCKYIRLHTAANSVLYAIDEIRYSTIARYAASNITMPTTRFSSDANTYGLWRLNDDAWVIKGTWTSARWTSTTSNSMSIGQKTFTVAAGLPIVAGQRLTIVCNGYNPDDQRMQGTVNSYTDTTLVITIDLNFGSVSNKTAWDIMSSQLYFEDYAANHKHMYDYMHVTTDSDATITASINAQTLDVITPYIYPVSVNPRYSETNVGAVTTVNEPTIVNAAEGVSINAGDTLTIYARQDSAVTLKPATNNYTGRFWVIKVG